MVRSPVISQQLQFFSSIVSCLQHPAQLIRNLYPGLHNAPHSQGIALHFTANLLNETFKNLSFSFAVLQKWWLCDRWTFLFILLLLPATEGGRLPFLLFLTISSCRLENASSRPSPVTPQQDLILQSTFLPRSLTPSSFSNFDKSWARGRSCLLASTRIGTLYLSVSLAIFNNSSLASSNLSLSHESTTKIIASVHLV